MIEITRSDCHKVISAKLKTDDFTIVNHHQIGFDEIIGYLGEHCTLKITVSRNSVEEILSFFVKTAPQVESQRKFLEDFNGIVKEKNFYTRYCPLLKKNGINILDNVVPTCYYATEESFIFEDLAIKGYKTLPSRIPLKIDCLKTALAAFAKLHASGLILEEVKSYRLTEKFEEELRESFYLDTKMCMDALQACKGGVKALVDLTYEENMKISRELFKEKGAEGCDLQIVFTKPSTKFRNTICHADPYAKNILFKFEEEVAVHAVICDYQTYRYGPPAQDILAFLHLATDRKMRAEHMDELLECYFKELSNNTEMYGFKDVVTREEFYESCVYYKHFALMQTLIHSHVVILSDVVASELFEDAEKARFVIFEDRYDFVKMVCEKDPVYRKRSFEAITDLREYFESELGCNND